MHLISLLSKKLRITVYHTSYVLNFRIIDNFISLYSLLWVPAPPKLSLHPSTVQNHLFPDYHSSSSSAEPADTLHLWTTPSWQLAAMGRGVGRTKEQGDSADGYPKKYISMEYWGGGGANYIYIMVV